MWRYICKGGLFSAGKTCEVLPNLSGCCTQMFEFMPVCVFCRCMKRTAVIHASWSCRTTCPNTMAPGLLLTVLTVREWAFFSSARAQQPHSNKFARVGSFCVEVAYSSRVCVGSVRVLLQLFSLCIFWLNLINIEAWRLNAVDVFAEASPCVANNLLQHPFHVYRLTCCMSMYVNCNVYVCFSFRLETNPTQDWHLIQ